METKEENIEYHIEIQNCDEGGENANGEVTYVLDLGGADIPENLAMQLAQLAADGSLNLNEGTNSIMVQNEMGGVNETHIMQIEREGLVEGEESQVIHLQMEDVPDYLSGVSAGSIAPPSSEMVFQDEIVQVEKSIIGKSKQKSVNTFSLLNRSSRIERPAKMSSGTKISKGPGLNLAMADPVTESLDQMGKYGKAPPVYDGKEKKGKGEKLPIYPYLKGKTPVMLTVADNGQLIPDGDNVKKEATKSSVEAKRPPIILDFTTEKNKLNSLLASLETSKSQAKAVSLSSPAVAEKDKLETTEPPVTQISCKTKEEEDLKESEGEKSDSEMPKLDPGTQSENTSTQLSVDKLESVRLDSDTDIISAPAEPTADLPRKSCYFDGCEFETSSPFDMAQHLETVHDDPLPYHCFECNKQFKLRLTYVIHELVHQKDARPAKRKRGPYGARHKFYQCPLCSTKKKLKQEIHLHAKNEHQLEKSKVLTCEACKFVCYSENELKAHNESVSHSEDRRSFCDICNQSFTNIYQHKAAIHSDARPFLCNQCGYSAKTKSSLRYHMVIHLDTKDWACTKCSYKSSSERRLKRHMKIHDPNKKHQCPRCNFATHDAYEFKRHFNKVHSRVRSYPCKFCGQIFMKHHEIRLHLMFEHECNDAFFCNFCDFTCASRADYKEHIQVHYGKNKHVCEICGFTGRYRTHYRRHMLTHSSDKPFTCKICFKSVREASNLRRHMLTHSEDKPLACSVCGYRCKIRSRLMNHMKTHSELRPFACHLCKYTTKFNGNLMKHLENHARYKPHKCQFCSYACNERNKLRRHMNFRHKDMADLKREAEPDSIEDNGDVKELVILPSSEFKKEDDGLVAMEEGGEEGKELVILPSGDLKKEDGGLVAMGEGVDGSKELVILPSQDFLFLPQEGLEKIVSMDENGTVITTDGSAIIVAANSQECVGDGSETHIVLSSQDAGLVSQLKGTNVLATFEEKAMESHSSSKATLVKDVDNGIGDSSS